MNPEIFGPNGKCLGEKKEIATLYVCDEQKLCSQTCVWNVYCDLL